MSRSKFDRQPVFEGIVASGLNLFSGDAVRIAPPEDDAIKAPALAALDPARAYAIKNRFPIPFMRDYMQGIAILDRRVIDNPDDGHVQRGHRNGCPPRSKPLPSSPRQTTCVVIIGLPACMMWLTRPR